MVSILLRDLDDDIASALSILAERKGFAREPYLKVYIGKMIADLSHGRSMEEFAMSFSSEIDSEILLLGKEGVIAKYRHPEVEQEFYWPDEVRRRLTELRTKVDVLTSSIVRCSPEAPCKVVFLPVVDAEK